MQLDVINQILNQPHNILVYLAALNNGRKSDFVNINKDKGDIFSEFYRNIFKERLLMDVNEYFFERVKDSLKEKYLVQTTPIAMKNEVYTSQQIFYDKETQVTVTQQVNEFKPGSCSISMHLNRMRCFN